MVAPQWLVRTITLCLLLQLSACSIYSLPGSKPVPAEGQVEAPVDTPPVMAPEPARLPPAPSSSAAYQPLLAKAEQATARGDYEQALALLERAQRIDPDNAEIYLGMAKTHHARGDRAQARATAERGLLYCSSNVECDALRGYTR